MILASDLDRTLLPNGHDPADGGAIDALFALIKNSDLVLVYVSGRNLQMMLDSVEEYHVKLPDYFIGEVGTRIYRHANDGMEVFQDWEEHIHKTNPTWRREHIERAVSKAANLELQEGWKQNPHKVSYYLKRHEEVKETLTAIESALAAISTAAEIIDSYDPLQKIGLIDILPKNVSKLAALEFLRRHLNESMADLIYCGDSGNDILPLTHGYRAIAVKNTPDDIKQRINKIAQEKGIMDKVYIARGSSSGNGNYASGIIEGLRHFGVIEQ